MPNFYKTLFLKYGNIRDKYAVDIISKGSILTLEQQVHLCRPLTDLEIKEALFSIPNTKSLRPDDFTSGFFKATWHLTGGLVCKVMKDFLITKKMPKELGIPRLISYSNAVYKCI